MELGEGGSSADWFFVGMAHWQRGDQAQARKWYNQAVKSMGKDKFQDPDLRRFRAEAESLLRVTEKPRPDKK